MDVKWLWLNGEYYRQTGDIGDQAVDAYMYAGCVGIEIGEPTRLGVYLHQEYLSGDHDPNRGSYHVFDTLYATNHKFYGYMDLFTDIPRDTFGFGLRDDYPRLLLSTERVAFTAAYHYFRLAEETPAGEDELGGELDLVLNVKLARGLAIEGGYSYFEPDDAMDELRGDVTEHWHYVMADYRF